ncbi:hypothetical protein EB796_002730 [Bugula neritina]|uniref:Uncharacterized protein n=1 Tax=Bugula neritina TaxID=10212 RepID=A0A7J7KLU3_BUGNE|nr:hypothetical protein EB796_002730 [Bugula neritina]
MRKCKAKHEIDITISSDLQQYNEIYSDIHMAVKCNCLRCKMLSPPLLPAPKLYYTTNSVLRQSTCSLVGVIPQGYLNIWKCS